MCITWPRICFTVHLLWCISYTIIGTIQVIVGVFFFALQFLKLCSNIWIGILNILFGLGGSVYAMVGTWTLAKQRAFLYMAITVLVVNVVNLVLLEVGEWHILLPENAKKLIEQGNLKMLLLYARTIANLSTLVAAFIAFIDSQITFCSMQYHERYYKKKSDKQDVLSDTEYVLPRVKSDSDENENASYFNKPYGQSWVYKTSTAESSTANSVPNRNSGASGDNLIEPKRTSTSASTPTAGSEVDSKDTGSSQKANVEQPVVVVEKTADYTDRQLHYMTSFSRTPSPVPASDSSSENSCSMHAPQLQERLKRVVDQATSNYRARLDSAKSTGAVVADRHSPCVSPRPPSVSGGEQLQPRHDSLTAADLQETSSQRSFKISADQIFIPLKDETVIRINDEVFVTPNKPRRSSPQPDAAARPQSGCSPADPANSASFSAAADGAPSPAADKAKSALPEVVHVIRKELIQKKSFGQPLPSPQAQSAGEKPTSPPSTFEPAEPPTACPPPTAASPADERPTTLASGEQSLEEAMRQYLGSPAAPDDKRELTPSPKDANVPSPTLERQTKVEHDDDAAAAELELELENEPYMFSRSQFDRQDTVIAATTLPTPTIERQTFIERQDAISILSPREDKSYILPPPQQELDSFPSPIETEASIGADTEDELAVSDEVDSNCSNNASVDKDTILDFKVSDDELEAVAAQEVQLPQFPDICDIRGRGLEVVQSSSHTLGNEIDNIFKIAEDPRLDDEVDREDADLFDLSSQSQQIDVDNIPPPDLDANIFADIPPPEETEDINGVDPEEWEESDDDSMNSSCVRRIPPPSTPSE